MAYSIIRFTQGQPSQIIERNLTLAEAREWCGRDDTCGDGWFDGYMCEDEDEAYMDGEQ